MCSSLVRPFRVPSVSPVYVTLGPSRGSLRPQAPPLSPPQSPPVPSALVPALPTRMVSPSRNPYKSTEISFRLSLFDITQRVLLRAIRSRTDCALVVSPSSPVFLCSLSLHFRIRTVQDPAGVLTPQTQRPRVQLVPGCP